MSTATIDAAKPAATKNPEKQYRDCILRGEHPTPELIDVSGRTEEDAIEDRETLAARRRAAAELLEAEDLERRAAAIVVPQPEDYGSKRVADCQTIAELFGALEAHRCQVDPRHVFISAEKTRKRKLQGDASSIRTAAMSILSDTCDRAIHATGETLGKKRSGLNSTVAEAGQFADLEARIAAVTRKMDQVRGDSDSTGPAKKVRLVELKAERTRLVDQRPLAAQAAVAALKASAAIAKLEEQRADNSAEMRIPERMKFTSTELPAAVVHNPMVQRWVGTPNPPGI